MLMIECVIDGTWPEDHIAVGHLTFRSCFDELVGILESFTQNHCGGILVAE